MTELRCLRCGHTWQARTEEPHVCPSCKSRLEIPPRKIVGLQIGGTVGPYDQVGMFVPMPSRPGVSVKVDISDFDPDAEVKKLLERIEMESIPNKEKISAIAKESLDAKDTKIKAEKIAYLVVLVQGISSIAVNAQRLMEWARVV